MTKKVNTNSKEKLAESIQQALEQIEINRNNVFVLLKLLKEKQSKEPVRSTNFHDVDYVVDKITTKYPFSEGLVHSKVVVLYTEVDDSLFSVDEMQKMAELLILKEI